MREATRYSNIIATRFQPEIVTRVDQAAAAQLMMKPAECIRCAIIDRLEADSMLPDHPAEALLATDPSGECAKKRYH